MKTFFDRMAVSCHLLDFAGKLGFTITTTYSNGQEKVKSYLKDLQNSMGIKNLNNYVFSRATDSIDEFIETNTKSFFKEIKLNYGYTDRYLEEKFNQLRDMYVQIDERILSTDEINTYEWEYWNQSWIKQCRSFQEFAVRNEKFKAGSFE